MSPRRAKSEARRRGPVALVCLILLSASCSSLPSAEYHEYAFPTASAYPGVPQAKHIRLGMVSAKVNYPSMSPPTLDVQREEAEFCRNYFNKAVIEMVALAQKKGGEAIIEIRSVVTYRDGKREVLVGPECTDDGVEGQVVTQAVVVKWLK